MSAFARHSHAKAHLSTDDRDQPAPDGGAFTGPRRGRLSAADNAPIPATLWTPDASSGVDSAMIDHVFGCGAFAEAG